MSKDTKATSPFLSFSCSHPPTCFCLFSMLHILKELCPEKKKKKKNHIGYFKGSNYCPYDLTHSLTPYLRAVQERSGLYFLLDVTAEQPWCCSSVWLPCPLPPEEVQTFKDLHNLASVSFLQCVSQFFSFTSLHPTTHYYCAKSCLFPALCFCSNLFF